MRSIRLVALLGLGTLAACCKSNLQSVPPQIQLLDSSGAALTGLSFPATGFGSESTQTFIVKSLSTTQLIVSSIQISGPAAAFYTLLPAPAGDAGGGGAPPVTLVQDQSEAFVVTFAPVATPPVPQGLIPEAATLTVSSNDPVNGTLALPITGDAAAPSVNVCWLRASGTQNTCLAGGVLSVQYGDVPLGKSNSSPPAVISISSLAAAGDAGVALTVTSVSIDDAGLAAGYALVNPIPKTPATLDGGSSLTYYVALFPTALGAATGSLIIESNDPHFPPGSPPQVSLSATVTPRSPPVACEGPVADVPATGLAGSPVAVDAGVLASWIPAPLDTVTITGIVDAGCSADAVDPQSALQFAFTFPDGGTPTGSQATLKPVAGKAAEATLQLDLAGGYQIDEVVTDLVGLQSNPAALSFTAVPRDDIAAQLTWTGSGTQGSGVQMQLDLHLVRNLGAGGADGGSEALLASDNDCWWDNCLLPLPRLQWGPGTPAGFGDPLVGTEFGQQSAPFPASAEAYTTLSGPQAGALYDLYVWYFHVESGNAVGPCATDTDCTESGYPHCNTLAASPTCVPTGNATLLLFVGGKEITGGGLTQALEKPCDLWHAGTLEWTSGGAQAGGGAQPDVYTFTPDTTVSSDAQTGLGGCVP